MRINKANNEAYLGEAYLKFLDLTFFVLFHRIHFDVSEREKFGCKFKKRQINSVSLLQFKDNASRSLYLIY